MAYQSGKTYYLIPICATGDPAYNAKILRKEVQPISLNIQGTGAHTNNRNVNVWPLDWSSDMQWKVIVGSGFARILCAGNETFGLDYYYGSDNPGNCDIYKVSGNDEDSKINFRTVSSTDNLYKLQCYRNDKDNDLYLTVMPDTNGRFTGGCDVRWQPQDLSKASQQVWWLVPIEDVQGGSSTGADTIIVENQRPSDCNMNSNSYRSNINPFYNGGYAGQCTWFVWGRVHEKLGKSITFSRSYQRNATDWIDIVTNCSISNTPVTHSIIVWGGTGNFVNGHVAFIEKIENGKIYFSEANWDQQGEIENPTTDGLIKVMTESQLKTRSSGHYFKGYLVP